MSTLEIIASVETIYLAAIETAGFNERGIYIQAIIDYTDGKRENIKTRYPLHHNAAFDSGSNRALEYALRFVPSSTPCTVVYTLPFDPEGVDLTGYNRLDLQECKRDSNPAWVLLSRFVQKQRAM